MLLQIDAYIGCFLLDDTRFKVRPGAFAGAPWSDVVLMEFFQAILEHLPDANDELSGRVIDDIAAN